LTLALQGQKTLNNRHRKHLEMKKLAMLVSSDELAEGAVNSSIKKNL